MTGSFIDVVDYLILPVYTTVLYSVAKFYQKKYYHDDPVTAKIFMWGFWVKMLGALFFSMLTEYYFHGGDTYMYFTEGTKLFNWSLKNTENLRFLVSPVESYQDYKGILGDIDTEGFTPNEGNFMAVRFVALFSFFAFNKYLIVALFFSFFSFTGLWKLYRLFVFFYPELKKQLAIPFLFLPSVIFWGSSVLKDPICLGCMGWVLSGFVNILYKKKDILWNIAIVIFMSWIIYLTKPYILLAFSIGIALWLVTALKEKIGNKIIKTLLFPFLISITIFGIIVLLDKIEEALGQYALDTFAENVKTNQKSYGMSDIAGGGSYFEVGDFEPTLQGMIKIAPKIINATFFRPYLWESKNLMMIFSALESLVLFGLTLYAIIKLRFFRFWSIIFTEPLVLFSFIFSIIFGFAVGITTPNFGTLMRYKIPCIPFFVAISIIVLHVGMKQKAKVALPAG